MKHACIERADVAVVGVVWPGANCLQNSPASQRLARVVWSLSAGRLGSVRTLRWQGNAAHTAKERLCANPQRAGGAGGAQRSGSHRTHRQREANRGSSPERRLGARRSGRHRCCRPCRARRRPAVCPAPVCREWRRAVPVGAPVDCCGGAGRGGSPACRPAAATRWHLHRQAHLAPACQPASQL